MHQYAHEAITRFLLMRLSCLHAMSIPEQRASILIAFAPCVGMFILLRLFVWDLDLFGKRGRIVRPTTSCGTRRPSFCLSLNLCFQLILVTKFHTRMTERWKFPAPRIPILHGDTVRWRNNLVHHGLKVWEWLNTPCHQNFLLWSHHCWTRTSKVRLLVYASNCAAFGLIHSGVCIHGGAP